MLLNVVKKFLDCFQCFWSIYMLLRECHTPDTPFNFIVGLPSILYKFQEIVTIFLTSIKLVFIVLSGILEIYVHFLVFQMHFFQKITLSF